MSWKENVSATTNEKATAAEIKKHFAWMNKGTIVHVRNGPTDLNYWLEVAAEVGSLVPMEEDALGNKTGNLFTDIKHPWHEPSNSFSHSDTRQPLHTDGSYEINAPRVSFFFCKQAPFVGGATIFTSLSDVKYVLKQKFSGLLQQLESIEVLHSKGRDQRKRPIIVNDTISWNYFRCEKCPTRDSFHTYLENYIVGGGVYESLKLQPGEAVFFEDQSLLHGRLAFVGCRWLVKGGLHV